MRTLWQRFVAWFIHTGDEYDDVRVPGDEDWMDR